MVPSHKLLLTVLGLTLAACPVLSQWTYMGPEGYLRPAHELTSFSFGEIDSSIFFTDGVRLYLSNNGGKTWEGRGGFGWDVFQVIPFDRKLIAVGDRRVLVSSDQGHSWSVMFGSDTLVAAAKYVTQIGTTLFIAVDPVTQAYASKYATGLVRSTDGGSTWMSLPFDSLKYCRGLVRAATGRFGQVTNSLIAAASYGPVFRSTDMGATWSRGGKLPSGVYFTALRSSITTLFEGSRAITFTRLYGAARNNGLYISDDLGTTWTKRGIGLESMEISGFCLTGVYRDTILAGTSKGLYLLGPSDSSWQRVTAGIPGECIMGMWSTGSSVLAGGETLGIFKSEDAGATWTHSSAGLPGFQVHYMTATDSALIIAGSSVSFAWGLNYYRSYVGTRKPGQGTWTLDMPGGVYDQVTSLDAVGNFALAGIYGAFLSSPDNGRSWVRLQPAQLLNASLRSLTHVMPGPVLYGGSGNGVYRSTDTGMTWAKCAGSMPDSGVWTLHAASLKVGGTTLTTLYAGTQHGTLYYSGTNGASWVNMNFPVEGQHSIEAIATSGPALLVGAYPHLYRTTNLGGTWTVSDSGLPDYMTVGEMSASGSALFLGCNQGIYVSQDDGLTWRGVNEGIGNPFISTLQVWRDTLYVSIAASGVWRRPLSQIVTAVGGRPASNIPERFVLEQNYPNPFNPSTTIRYSVPYTSRATLSVFDALGREVARLVDGMVDAGDHEIRFNGSNLASGVYFYRLYAGEFVQTKHLLFLK